MSRRIRHILIALFTGLLLPYQAISQSKAELKEFFIEAESHFLYEEYDLATPLYMVIYQMMPNNANIAYKIGVCYLNTPHEKEKAISYLEEAAKSASYEANEESFNETRAPLDVFFQLGNAYRVNNMLDKAIKTYKYFKEQMKTGKEMINADFVDQQIIACENAQKLMSAPVPLRKKNLGDTINLSSLNENPVISGDGNSLVFTAYFGEDFMLYYSKKVLGRWTTPRDITDEIGSDKDCSSTCLSYDGTELYVYKIDNFVGNIYVSRLQNDRWSKIEKLNKNINTKFYESHAAISKDGQSLYFSSNREGGHGKLDIYVSHRDKNGDWGPATNLGPIINTRYNENTPFITMNDSLLYFSSEGHYNMGGYDIFVSRRKGDGWSKPENVGYPLNTTDNDLHFQPFLNGRSGYKSMDNGYKETAIYRIDFLATTEAPWFEIKGIVTVDSVIEPSIMTGINIRLIDTLHHDTTDIGRPDLKSGWYFFRVQPGNYHLSASGEGVLPTVENVLITEDAVSNEFFIDLPLKKDTSWVAPVIEAPLPALNTLATDSLQVITNVMVRNEGYEDLTGRKFLYFTVQVMALLKPVDVSYFKNIPGRVVILHGKDAFYRYTYGQFQTLEEAKKARRDILRRGYPDVFVKKVYSDSEDKPQQ
jgi:hypothetical protein